MKTFEALADMRPYQIWSGAVARAISGDRLTLAVIELDPDLSIPEHEHENEQLGFVLMGHVTMVIAGRELELAPGDMYVIPAHLPHSAQTTHDGATVVDAFSPVRADWSAAKRLEPSPGRWP